MGNLTGFRVEAPSVKTKTLPALASALIEVSVAFMSILVIHRSSKLSNDD
jgi:hypothetical protein